MQGFVSVFIIIIVIINFIIHNKILMNISVILCIMSMLLLLYTARRKKLNNLAKFIILRDNGYEFDKDTDIFYNEYGNYIEIKSVYRMSISQLNVKLKGDISNHE